MDGRESTRNMQYTLLWEDMLRDNLLNFAGTPKGLLLLQQTGAVNECVSYMHSRYARKVQVNVVIPTEVLFLINIVLRFDGLEVESKSTVIKQHLMIYYMLARMTVCAVT